MSRNLLRNTFWVGFALGTVEGILIGWVVWG